MQDYKVDLVALCSTLSYLDLAALINSSQARTILHKRVTFTYARYKVDLVALCSVLYCSQARTILHKRVTFTYARYKVGLVALCSVLYCSQARTILYGGTFHSTL
jgi:hypothetical protein